MKIKEMSTIFSKGFSTDYGRYRSQLTTKKSQEKSLVIFAQNVPNCCAPGYGLLNILFIAYNSAEDQKSHIMPHTSRFESAISFGYRVMGNALFRVDAQS